MSFGIKLGHEKKGERNWDSCQLGEYIETKSSVYDLRNADSDEADSDLE